MKFVSCEAPSAYPFPFRSLLARFPFNFYCFYVLNPVPLVRHLVSLLSYSLRVSGMMFTSTGSRGLYKAPLSKSLLLLPTVLTVLLTVLLPQYQDLFIYNLQAVRQGKQFWRLVSGRLICLDLKDTFCSSLLIYNFRIFERRFGSHKFASFLFGAWILSAFVDLLLIEALRFMFELKVDVLPAGLLGPVFALFVPFYSSIPRVQVTQLLGHISITNKSLTYIVGAQLLTSSAYMWVVACSGLIAGMLYYSNKLAVQRFIRVPGWAARFSSVLLEPVFSDSEPTAEAPLGMGATLDIQRQQRMDMLDQQLLLSQLAHLRRNAQQQQAQTGLLNWNRFFPTLRHRGQNRHHEGPQPQQPPYIPPPDNTAVAEEQVARLMEMGFSRMDAQEALRASNNDINIATNFLLQH
ncbi:ubiquitin-associated domain-containing protein 2 isoform X2 [Cyprinus carpio]|uniref:Ubiquitin-associated domain-containing protein 2 isoform X2 n=1 Tax=Cyprinus carpio TaxID=7962 RepID=A0A9Q9UZV2_CYPCA|nr:ubiquitin-associated domain-containing protein 2 isoform X2 [Cyprinus carpio]